MEKGCHIIRNKRGEIEKWKPRMVNLNLENRYSNSNLNGKTMLRELY
jgi:hypothetical protein